MELLCLSTQNRDCDFVNNYFATIADRVCNSDESLDYIEGDISDGIFNKMESCYWLRKLR